MVSDFHGLSSHSFRSVSTVLSEIVEYHIFRSDSGNVQLRFFTSKVPKNIETKDKKFIRFIFVFLYL